MSPDPHPPVIVVTGPTAGGKSAWSRRIAQDLDVPLISLDSMKVYRRMDIGTAKPSRADGVAWHLLDVREPWEEFSVGNYLTEIERLRPQLGSPWVFCGGTAFYLNALLEGLFDGPDPDPEFRARLEEEARSHGSEVLHRRLAELDPPSGAKIHPHDVRRLVRALEVIEATGQPFSALKSDRQPFLTSGRFRLLGIARTREELYQRIDARVERMFEAGWIEEVESLLADHDPPWSEPAAQSIGYQQIREALRLGEDPRERIPVIQQRTRNFAKNQLTWFRKMPIEWWHPSELEEGLDTLCTALDGAENGELGPPDPVRSTYAGM